MVPPNGVSFARSGSTWIHWKSSVASANALMRSWVTSCQSLTPSSSPILDLSSSGPVMVSMAGSLAKALVVQLGPRGLGFLQLADPERGEDRGGLGELHVG